MRRIFYRCVDWNKRAPPPVPEPSSRIFYRCVDWNTLNTIIPLCHIGASFTDAWIETTPTSLMYANWRRIFYRCVDWNPQIGQKDFLEISRIFYRCVDWNIHPISIIVTFHGSHLLQMRGLKHGYRYDQNPRLCRIFYRCVDWNNSELVQLVHGGGRIFYRCVDWNLKLKRHGGVIVSHLLQMRGLKLLSLLVIFLSIVASFTDAWIETFLLV